MRIVLHSDSPEILLRVLAVLHRRLHPSELDRLTIDLPDLAKSGDGRFNAFQQGDLGAMTIQPEE